MNPGRFILVELEDHREMDAIAQGKRFLILDEFLRHGNDAPGGVRFLIPLTPGIAKTTGLGVAIVAGLLAELTDSVSAERARETEEGRAGVIAELIALRFPIGAVRRTL